MAIQSMNVKLPEQLYLSLRDRAKQSKRTVEAELIEVVAAALPLNNALPDDLAQAVATLDLLDDASLMRAAQSRLAAEISNETEQLHLKRQREGLTEQETQQLSVLVRQYERIMLIRARAVALLKQRKYDISTLIAKP